MYKMMTAGHTANQISRLLELRQAARICPVTLHNKRIIYILNYMIIYVYNYYTTLYLVS